MTAPTLRARRGLALALLAIAAFASGCGTVQPAGARRRSSGRSANVPLLQALLGGPKLRRPPAAATDGLKSYSAGIGDSVYYGDCVSGKGLLGGGGSCLLPLQVTTVIYSLHSNAPLGPQRNVLIRGVPATDL